MPRITINEIARRCGVSKGAVSYALNGRPGVSAETRERILTVARELGWAPNWTARMLSGSRTEAFGLVLTRNPRVLGSEPFFMELISGIESVLSERSYALLLQVTADMNAELDTYRKWNSERRVDGVIIVDLRLEDPRIPLLNRLDLPVLCIADPSRAGTFPCVWTDDATAMTNAVDYLVGLGHRRIARVSGTADHGQVEIRARAFTTAAKQAGVDYVIAPSDFSAEAGRTATRELMMADDPPTAIVYDNDIMAVAGLSTCHELGVTVPDEVSLLAWDDSALCQVTHPALSAMSHDVMAYGAHAARRMFETIEGNASGAYLDSTPTLTERGSTGPPRPLRGKTG
ncbi:LacI family DNA-binding transcriptional regulator [Microlunatus speluncae]|uniref:LacI family DNA-binding transcriptional regulator n=1 Tax=Microlunatus speluncae TaxID=2594267 RepID=UPI0012664C07|nr:LacI family DNA-binding transcriptional regulator [Microlunatus speluncae]